MHGCNASTAPELRRNVFPLGLVPGHENIRMHAFQCRCKCIKSVNQLAKVVKVLRPPFWGSLNNGPPGLQAIQVSPRRSWFLPPLTLHSNKLTADAVHYLDHAQIET